MTLKKVIRRQKYSTFLEVVKAASDEEQQQKTNKTTAALDQMSLKSGGFGNCGGEQQPRGKDWNCSCGYKNFAFRRVCNSCKYRRGDGNGLNRENLNRGGGKYGNRGNNHGRGNLNNWGQQQQHGQQRFIKNAVLDKNEKQINNQQQKRHQRSHSDPSTKATAKKNKQQLEKDGEATVDSEKEEPTFYLD
uniref:RanBP2-type domain-containing protein n=1 Tax=Panagrolaimus sp. PS1159 TaxID=55785 RepID=A0AC35G0N6_9BILA